jgi:hypothetical protein
MLFSGSVRKVRTARQSSPCSVRRRAESAAHRTRQSDLPDRLRRADASPATRHTEVAPAPAGEWKTSRQFPARHEDEIESTFLGSSYFPCENWRFGPKTPYWPRTCKIVRCANTQSRKALMQAALRVITATFRTDSTITPFCRSAPSGLSRQDALPCFVPMVTNAPSCSSNGRDMTSPRHAGTVHKPRAATGANIHSFPGSTAVRWCPVSTKLAEKFGQGREQINPPRGRNLQR